MTAVAAADGLISARLLDGKGGARHLDWAGIAAWRPADGVLWLHLDYGGPAARAFLETGAGLEPVVRAALLADDPRPRSLVHAGGLIAIVRGVNHNLGAEPEDMVSARMWIEERRIITLRHRPLRATAVLDDALDHGVGPTRPGELVVRFFDLLLDRISELIVSIDDAVDALEDALVGAEPTADRQALATVRRRVIGLRRFLGPQREAMARLVAEPLALLTADDRVQLREESERLSRVLDTLDAMRERAAVCQDQLASATAEVVNRRLYALSLAAAVFLPLGLITGLLGLDVGGLPLRDNPYGFVIVLGAIAALSGFQLVLLRRLKWL